MLKGMNPDTNVPSTPVVESQTPQPTQPIVMPPAEPAVPAPVAPVAPVEQAPARQEQPMVNQPQGTPTRKTLLLVWAAIAAALLLANGGMLLWASHAKSQYLAAVPGYETRARGAYDYFGGLKSRLTHGADIQQKFDDTLVTAPKEPKLFGKSLAPADKAKRVADLTNALRKFETAYVSASDVSVYSDKALTAMASVTGTLDSPAAIKTMLPKLAQAKAAIAAGTQPDAVKSFHASLMAKYDTAIRDMNDAANTYDSKNADAYAKAVAKLPADFQALNTNGARATLKNIFDTTYGKADTAYGELQSVLGV